MKRFVFVLLAVVFIAIPLTKTFGGKSVIDIQPGISGASNLADKRTGAQGATEVVAIAFYEYRPAGRRDPFMPLTIKPAPAKQPQMLAPEFRLIATLWNKDGYYALIRLPDGRSYTIREGMDLGKLGLHGGRVYKITKDFVIIREKIRDHKRVLTQRDIILKLRPEDER